VERTPVDAAIAPLRPRPGERLAPPFADVVAGIARRLETDPALASIAAVRACAAFVPRKRVGKALRIACAFGFDTTADPRSATGPGRVFGLGENLLCWALAWAFNPAGLRRGGLRRQRCELWISREDLLARYGGRAMRRAPVSRSGDGQ
jgi:hypothetical protein